MKKLYLFLFLTIPFNLVAEAIYTNDGKIIYGKITQQNTATITIKNRYTTFSIKKTNIKKISYATGLGTISAFFKNGKTISGTLISINSKQLVIREDTKPHLEHTVPRNRIENLFLEKFDDREKNELEFSGGVIQSLGKMQNTANVGYIDFTLQYSSSLSSNPNMFLGANFSYMYLDVDNDSPLDNPTLLFNSILVSWEYRYPLFTLISNSAFTNKLQFFTRLHTGISIITLKEENRNSSGNYMTFQGSAGLGYNLTDKFTIKYSANYFYVYQSEQPYTAIRHKLGIGWMF